ncbi:hypothetical protein SARC_07504 [Sphaeroforma arctica JP610]|uniref:Glycoside-hydrolase family GH114 TIM-barrel domain-containing protein n=1 Tax=Sphaeroforma arctica JP610 TaxID=667725 RepID=A0A0L0FUA8_9EUKA|nr:hypothetical protein SARC_07504 [Sphaeroforma arctica JP610]KNC80131.1 hypothetical protein SARC_07504 [Sphaeroforma arctica JP610]|eukprot:XP_014154033.1 hypothetical protein SARC_07504 [Sphaeroforma arctica JP610]
MMSIKASVLLLALACNTNAKALSKRGYRSSTEAICNRAWSNSGSSGKTDCTGADWIFSSVGDRSSAVSAGLKNSAVTSMAYLSVGTVNTDFPADPRLSAYTWEENSDSNGQGGLWGDHWFNPDDLVPHILPIMKDIMDDYKAQGFNAISTDNAKPSDAVTDNDSVAARHRANDRIDPRYVEYMAGIVDYAHSIGMKVALKNPSFYVNEPSIIHKFDAYIVESLFNWYPYDIDNYNGSPNLLTGSKPMWIFQYEGINGLSNSKLRERMVEQGVETTYMDTNNGWVEFHATQ